MDYSFLEFLVTIVVAVISSSGLWAFLSKIHDKKSGSRRLLIGLAHDRILFLAEKYCERGCITKEEYDDLHTYLYEPYKECGGNGSAERMMKKVDGLTIKSLKEVQQVDDLHDYVKATMEELQKGKREVTE